MSVKNTTRSKAKTRIPKDPQAILEVINEGILSF